MPNLIGHAISGTPYITIGLWYIVMTFRRFYKAKATGSEFKVTASNPADCFRGCMRHLPVDGLIKFFGGGMGLIVEWANGRNPDGNFDVHSTQHVIVCGTYVLSGVIDFLPLMRVPLPEGADFLSFGLALVVQATMFLGHLPGREPLDVLVHTYAIILPYLAAVVIVLEAARRPRHFLAPVAKGYFILLLGTWFWQIGFILYNPFPGAVKWDQFDNDNKMQATAMFCIHAIVNFFITVTIGTVIAWRHGHSAPSWEQGNEKGQNSVSLEELNDESSGLIPFTAREW